MAILRRQRGQRRVDRTCLGSQMKGLVQKGLIARLARRPRRHATVDQNGGPTQ